MRHLLLALTALVLCPAVGWCQSTIYQINGKSFDLPTPTGFCLPDAKNSNDALFIKAKTALMANYGYTVAKIAARCDELKRRDNPVDLIIYYYYPDSTENQPPAQGSIQSQRKTICDDMRKETDASLSNVPDKVAETAKELHVNLSVSKVKSLGLLAEDSHACYSGILVTTKNAAGPYIANVDYFGTVIHGKKIWASLYSKYQNPSESQKSLLLLESIAADLEAKNPD